jgi:selenocysteine lyase/cysteine desulfurase
VNRRDFAKLLASTGAAATWPWFNSTNTGALAFEGLSADPLPPTPQAPDEAFWKKVRSRFLLPQDVAFLNAANLCPASLASVEALEKHTRLYEADPSPTFRSGLMQLREEARKLLAGALRVAPEDVVFTRNTTEANNFVSSGLALGAGDDVVVWADNHPSNLNAWRTKATRFGFNVISVPVPASHPGTEGYVDLFAKAFTPRTKIVAITHVSSNSGDLLPAREIVAAARSRGILSLVDGAQAFGLLDLNLAEMQPDFYTGSMHKWPCGPKEKGLLYVRREIQDRLHPSVVGLYGGQVGLSRTFEACGQRDDAAMASLLDAVKFQDAIGRSTIETRTRALAQRLIRGLGALPGVKLWTSTDPARSAGIVIFQPGAADPRQVGTMLLEKHRIISTTRGGQTNPGLRLSPHFFNTLDEIDRTIAAVKAAI